MTSSIERCPECDNVVDPQHIENWHHPACKSGNGGAVPQEGRKDDNLKLPFHLLAPEFLEEVSRVLDFGARKYSARNWEKGMAWHRPFAALMRHMWAWWRGEALDLETGYSHLAHAACCIMFLLAYEKRGVGTDDRPKD